MNNIKQIYLILITAIVLSSCGKVEADPSITLSTTLNSINGTLNLASICTFEAGDKPRSIYAGNGFLYLRTQRHIYTITLTPTSSACALDTRLVTNNLGRDRSPIIVTDDGIYFTDGGTVKYIPHGTDLITTVSNTYTKASNLRYISSMSLNSKTIWMAGSLNDGTAAILQMDLNAGPTSPITLFKELGNSSDRLAISLYSDYLYLAGDDYIKLLQISNTTVSDFTGHIFGCGDSDPVNDGVLSTQNPRSVFVLDNKVIFSDLAQNNVSSFARLWMENIADSSFTMIALAGSGYPTQCNQYIRQDWSDTTKMDHTVIYSMVPVTSSSIVVLLSNNIADIGNGTDDTNYFISKISF